MWNLKKPEKQTGVGTASSRVRTEVSLAHTAPELGLFLTGRPVRVRVTVRVMVRVPCPLLHRQLLSTSISLSFPRRFYLVSAAFIWAK